MSEVRREGNIHTPMFVYHIICMRAYEIPETLLGSSVNCGNGMTSAIERPSEKLWRRTQSTATYMLCLGEVSQEIIRVIHPLERIR